MADVSMREKILDATERRARTGGYHGFSFRDIAEDVGIKSASVHYHFPTKPELMVAVADRYAERAATQLTPPKDAADALSQVADLFRHALKVDKRMCLCGLLGAERDTIPDVVSESASGYFRMLIEYLDAELPKAPGAVTPASVVATLEGGLILARNLRDPKLFETIVGELGSRLG